MRIRSKILLACAALTSVTIALGLFVLQGQRNLGILAMNMYDDAVMSISYARSAETKFVAFRGRLIASEERLASVNEASGSRRGEISERQVLLAIARGQSAAATGNATKSIPAGSRAIDRTEVEKAVTAVQDDLNVALERAMSEDGRQAAKKLRERVGEISVDWNGNGAAKDLDGISRGFDQLVELYAADGLQLRINAEDLVSRGIRSTMIAIAASVAIALLITWLLTSAIVPAVRAAARFAEEIAEGRLDNVIILPRRRGRSETAALLVGLSRMQNAIRESLAHSEQLSAEKAQVEQAQALLRKAEICKFADDFELAVCDIIDAVSAASSELESSAGMLTATAERSQELAIAVASASEETTGNVLSVAKATERMAQSVYGVGRQVRDSTNIASEAVKQANTTNERVANLSRAASRIGDVVELINTIAGQTNLLALNATIEAARAGDAGRGFAVVASEVKALAEQTAKATEEISRQVGGIQTATGESVVAIKEIGDTIVRMSEIASMIASTVEEQAAANQDISRDVQHAAEGTQQVSSSITEVQRGAGETGSASTQVLSAAQSLAGESGRLKVEVKRFLDMVRAA